MAFLVSFTLELVDLPPREDRRDWSEPAPVSDCLPSVRVLAAIANTPFLMQEVEPLTSERASVTFLWFLLSDPLMSFLSMVRSDFLM